MEIKGKIIATPPPKAGVSARGPWEKAFIVVQYEDGQFPRQLLLGNMNKSAEFKTLRVGQSGTFKFDGSVRENKGNYFLDLNCWAWTIDNQQQETTAVTPQPTTVGPDLPF